MDAAQHGFSNIHQADPTSSDRPHQRPGISLIIPAYNEQDVILQSLGEADTALAELTDDYEILIIDDGSRDATFELATGAAARYPAIRVIAHGENRGYGAALRTGFRAATKQYVGFTDADCQFDLRELDRHILLLSSCDIACGYRIDRQDGWLRNFYSRLYNILIYLLLGTRVRDCDCALKLFRREALQRVTATSDGFLINAELLTKARLDGLKIIEVGVTHRPRERGKSTVSVRHVIPVLAALSRFWWSTILFPRRIEPNVLQQEAWSAGKTSLAIALLLLLSGVVLFGNLAYPFFEPDESRYAQIALEMVQSGDYVVPRLHGEPYLDKPPLLYWSTAVSFCLFGPTEMAARLPSAVAAMLTVLTTFLLGKRILGERVALTGALMLFLCLGFVLSGRFLIMDGVLTLFTTTSILASFLATNQARMHWGWWALAAAACGLGILTKGPIAAVLVLPPLIAVQWLGRGRVRLKVRHWLAFLLATLLITAPWFVLIARQQGDFAMHFLWKHHVVRFVAAFDHQEPFWYYVPVLLIGMFPCSLLAAPVVAFMLGRSKSQRHVRTQELGTVATAAAWIVVFFSLSSCKLPTYILPAVPFICLVSAAMVRELWKESRPPMALENIAHQLPLYATGLAVIAGVTLAILGLLIGSDALRGQPLSYGAIAAALFAFAYLVWHRHRRPARASNWTLAAGISLLIMAVAFQNFVPEFAGQRSVNANVARLLANLDNKNLPVVYMDWQIDGYAFYCPSMALHRYTEDDLDTIVRLVREHDQIMLVANRSGVDLLEEALGGDAQFTRARGARGRIYLVSSSAPAATLAGTHPNPGTRRH